jgi:hypothetical protein
MGYRAVIPLLYPVIRVLSRLLLACYQAVIKPGKSLSKFAAEMRQSIAVKRLVNVAPPRWTVIKNPSESRGCWSGCLPVTETSFARGSGFVPNENESPNNSVLPGVFPAGAFRRGTPIIRQ